MTPGAGLWNYPTRNYPLSVQAGSVRIVLATPLATLLVALGLLAVHPSLRAAPRDLQRPMRLTAGESAQYMGQPTRDGSRVAFVTNRQSTSHIEVVSGEGGGRRSVIDDWADASAPRWSPRQNRIAYIGTTQDALGDICIALASGRDRQCFYTPGVAEADLFWFGDEQSLGVLRREGLHGDFAWVRASARDGRPLGELARNVVHPTLSPSERWFVAVEVERTHDRVGMAFALRASGWLQLIDLRQKQPPQRWRPDLPGSTSLPHFSPDGRWLYFVQYLNDTNFDGVVDGTDNGVLFRVPFEESADAPLQASGSPVQLTAAPWNCQYPVPHETGLVATCALAGSLDIYSLPPHGAVPQEWNSDRLRAEAAVVRDRWEQLLLLGHLAAREKQAGREPNDVWAALLRVHLQLGELESAEWYGQRWARSGDPRAEQWRRLVAHRAGHTLTQLPPTADAAPTDPAALALHALVRSEIFETHGQATAAFDTFRQANPDSLSDPLDLDLYAQRAISLSRRRADRALATLALSKIAQRLDVPAADAMRYADAWLREATAGLPAPDRAATLRSALENATEGSALATRTTLEIALEPAHQGDQEASRQAIFDLYRRNSDPARRRAIALESARAGVSAGATELVYQMVNTWAGGLDENDAERDVGEALYRAVVLERAFDKWARGEVGDARGLFFGAMRLLPSLDAHLGFIAAASEEGTLDIPAQYARIYRREPDAPPVQAMQVVLAAREVDSGPHMQPTSAPAALADSAAKGARDLAKRLPQSAEAQHLRAFALAHRWLHSRESETAADAIDQGLLARDLFAGLPRGLAPALELLALVQSGVGNHHRARVHFEERERLAFESPLREFAVKLAHARSLYFTDRRGTAARHAERALHLAQTTPELAPYLALAADRAALYRYAKGHGADAAAHYLIALSAPDAADPDPQLNRFRRLLGLGAALLISPSEDAPQQAVEALTQAAAQLDALEGSHTEPLAANLNWTALEARAAVLGLLAQANCATGDFQTCIANLTERAELLEERKAIRPRATDNQEQAQAQLQLAELAHKTSDLIAAATFATRALEYAQQGRATTQTAPDWVEAEAARTICELASMNALPPKARTTLNQARPAALDTWTALCATQDPDLRGQREALAAALALWDAATGR